MVCKNCGADLKPGSKYCLECGNYIEDEDLMEEESSEEFSPVPRARGPVKRKRKKLVLTTTDYLIYGGLLLVLFISILVIIVTLVKDSSQPETPAPTVSTPATRANKKLNIDDYSIEVPGDIDSTVQGSFLYATDNVNYKFSFQIKEEKFEDYYEKQATLKEQLIESNQEVLSIFEKRANNRLFLLYEIQSEGSKKVLYLTKINSKYTTFGKIELFDNGDWQQALPQIAEICDTVNFQFE